MKIKCWSCLRVSHILNKNKISCVVVISLKHKHLCYKNIHHVHLIQNHKNTLVLKTRPPSITVTTTDGGASLQKNILAQAAVFTVTEREIPACDWLSGHVAPRCVTVSSPQRLTAAATNREVKPNPLQFYS